MKKLPHVFMFCDEKIGSNIQKGFQFKEFILDCLIFKNFEKFKIQLLKCCADFSRLFFIFNEEKILLLLF